MKKMIRMAAVLLAVLMLFPAAGAFADTGALGGGEPQPAPTPTPQSEAPTSSGTSASAGLGDTPPPAPASTPKPVPASGSGGASAPANAKEEPGIKYVALTFDDGPSSSNTPKTLDMLKKYGVRATFFVLGSRVKGNEALLGRMVDEGHEIGSHAYSHKRLTSLSIESVEYEMQRTNSLVYAACGVTPRLMRPPYGSRNARVLACLAEMGFPCVLWSIDPEDWKATSARAVRDYVVARAKNGSIILMHDLKSTSVAAAEMIVKDLLARGYVFVTVSELLGGSPKAGATYTHG
ncbi:MAG TPA: polysaccharide deacetylase family protein [Clostridia bacterium]|nr:polysaccharide deacetylase family protein [Clostridia bacterium]HPK16931.1 polysaccharide deacetylase family protein [Clostridia bacterium]